MVDPPKSESSPEWFVCEVFCDKSLAPQYCVHSYRIAEGAPLSYAPRGSLSDGLPCQFAARASALVPTVDSDGQSGE